MAYDYLYDYSEYEAGTDVPTAEEMDRARDAAQWIESRMLRLATYDEPAQAPHRVPGLPPPGWQR